jgi:choline dehydrogenase-like flavoprotein
MTDLLRADAVVIGSGAGGAPVACALAEAGREVLVLEAGERFEAKDFAGDEGALVARLMTAATVADGGLEVYAGACVGGSTVVNDALCWRPPPEILESWRREHGLGGLTEAAFAPHVDRVWERIHAAPTERVNRNRNSRLMERGAAQLGWSGEAMHRNVRNCVNVGRCNTGCPSGAKQSALLTWLPDAEAHGARIEAGMRAERIVVEAGRVRAVEAVRLDPATRKPAGHVRIETPVACAAAGVLGTPALLLRSGLDRAGRGVAFHSSVYVAARYPEPVLGFFGPTMSYAVTEWSDVHGKRGPGFMLESVTTAAATTAGGLPGFGAAHEAAMAALPHLARIVVVLRDRTRGTVSLGRDGAASLSYVPVSEDLERLREAVRACGRIHFAAGAEEVFLPVHALPPAKTERGLALLDTVAFEPRALSLLYAVHLFGGAPMGGSRETAFCDETGRAWDVAGLYVCDASSLPSNTGANPQVTIQANALRIAAGIAA